MNMQAPIVEISSSDDEGEIQSQSGSYSFKMPSVSDDDDEITVIDSLPCYEKKNNRSKRAKKLTRIEDFENDCLILEGDPEKVLPDSGSCPDESEDLVVTAEKGQVACRDFPHPRHLCFKFPFKNTPHEKYCEKCHCYVCDKPAPCLSWGKENPDKDHCHSSDKEDKWKKLRNFYKMRDCKEPPIALQHSFNTILSLTTMRTAVPVSRSNQANAGTVFPLQLNLNTDSVQSTICRRSDLQRPLYSISSRNRSLNKEVTPSGYTNHVASQTSRVGRTGSRYGSSYRKSPSNLGLYGQGAFPRRSQGNRFSADSLQRQRNCINMHFTNNMPNTLDACSTTQTQSINFDSSEQNVNRDFTCAQNLLDDDDYNKLLDIMLRTDSEDSRTQNVSSNDASLNITLNPSCNSDLTNMTMQPNASTHSLSCCVVSNHELQLLPQSSVSVGVFNAVDNAVQWSHAQNMPPSSAYMSSAAVEQCPYPSDFQNLNCDWLNETAYPPLHTVIEPWAQVGSDVTAMGQSWSYVAAPPSIRINESVVSENISGQNVGRNDTESVGLTPQPQQQGWPIPLIPHPDVSNTAAIMCSQQGFATPSTLAPALYVDLNNSWEMMESEFLL